MRRHRPVSGSECGAAEGSGEIYLRWERSSSEISAIGAKAETMPVSRVKGHGEPTGETGLKTIGASNCWECIPEI